MSYIKSGPEHPSRPDILASRRTTWKRFADSVVERAMADLHDPEQLDVLKRAGEIVCQSAEGGQQQRL